MTSLLIVIASMLMLGLLAWLAGKFLRLPVCPVCVGVAGTWLWMIAARLGGYAVDTALVGILLGASVVGFAQAIETRLPPRRSPLVWKALALPVGIVAAAGLAGEHWGLAGAAGAALALLTAGVLWRRDAKTTDSAVVSELEERMKKCC
ncbi:MAG: hypothetical protein OEW90_07755 [Betaproteobacteria bacterium]|nr:hypothetical protein [Betaproteobacteria bacterium]MDH4324018.1 hypothetical protein [Betaproteobacteria bacterium]